MVSVWILQKRASIIFDVICVVLWEDYRCVRDYKLKNENFPNRLEAIPISNMNK